jgi:lipopolysaccharide assembly protein B
MPLEYLWLLLLPVAAASGWWMARYSLAREQGRARVPPDYFKGINFLLNEQPDKAIEIFTKMVEVDSDTVEPYFALGSLFRRQGEVERAIRIHQNLIARPSLHRVQRNHALFELGQDYQQAGLLDRAEHLYLELLEREPRNVPARRLLIDIYEQEKDWEKAITIAASLESQTTLSHRQLIAQYYCELARIALDVRDFHRARKMIRRAYSNDRNCVRASLLAGESACLQDNCKAAIRALKRVDKQDPRFLSEAVGPLLDCYERLGRTQDAIDWLEAVLMRQEAFKPVLMFVQFMQRHGAHEAACRFLTRHQQVHPSLPGIAYLLETLPAEASAPEHRERLAIARDSISKLLDEVSSYNCINCVYKGGLMHWQCPSCRSWNTIFPYQGSPG